MRVHGTFLNACACVMVNGKPSSFIQRFTVLSDIPPFMHTFIHRRRSVAVRVRRLEACSMCCIFPHFDNYFPVVVRHAVRSLFASHQSTHKQSRSRLLRTCEPSSHRLNSPGGNSDFQVLFHVGYAV